MLFSFFQNTDTKLIAGIKQEGLQSRLFEDELYKKYVYLVKSVGVIKQGLLEEDAKTAYHDTINAVILAIVSDTFEQKSSLKTFMHRIFLNKCVDLVRKNTTNKETANNQANLSDMDDVAIRNQIEREAAESSFATQDTQAFLLHLIKQLRAKCQVILLVAAYYGYKDEEIAELVNLSSGKSVSVTKRRCEAELRELYEKHYH